MRYTPHPGEPYVTVLSIKMNPEALKVLDRLRGKMPRSTYMRNLLRAENLRDFEKTTDAQLSAAVKKDGWPEGI